MTWDGEERRILSCGEMDVRMRNIERRCDIKERDMKQVARELSSLQTRVDELERDGNQMRADMDAVTAFKNKSIGYLSALAVVAGLIVDKLKDYLN